MFTWLPKNSDGFMQALLASVSYGDPSGQDR